MSLARRILAQKTKVPLGYSTATVVTVAPLAIDLGDGVLIAEPPCAGNYTPTIGDVVFVLRPADGLLVLCNIV